MPHSIKALCTGFLLGLAPWLCAQTDSTGPFQFFSVDGYLDAYYIFDGANPADHNRPGFLYAFNRHNEVNLNIGMIRLRYDRPRIRANFGLMAGTYANANLAAEPGVLKNVLEANAGVRLSKNKQLWVDVGIFSSHIGFESAIGADCWTMTRSMAAENSPYYSAGVQLSYASDNGQWYMAALLINGWQRIYRVDGNQLPAFGHQLTWTPTDAITLNSSSFVGSDTPDSTRLMRYFHNLYGQFQLSERFGLKVGFDIGAQQASPNSSNLALWYTSALIARYAFSEQVALAARAEYYSDVDQVMIASGTANGFQTLGFSLNVDVQILKRVLWRVEGRWFRSIGDQVFVEANQTPTLDNFAIGTALSFRF